MKGYGELGLIQNKKFPYMAAIVACKGDHACSYGCKGCGNCIEVCKFDAIHINDNGVAFVDEDKCIACGMCVRACPQNIIHIHDCANYIVVKCSNHDKGVEARKQCDVSCIGCGICERTCTAEAISVKNYCAEIDEKYCLSCGMCLIKCPRHVINDTLGILRR